VAELSALLQHLDESDVRSFILRQIKKLDQESIRTAYHNVLPINSVLPNDVMQLILSFDPHNHHRAVCKQWNTNNIQNPENALRTMYRSVLQKHGPLPANNDTWIMDEEQTSLHPVVESGFKGILGSLAEAELRCKNGDRVLIHPGVYRFGIKGNYMRRLRRNVHFIGLQATNVIFDNQSTSALDLTGNISMENICFQSRWFRVLVTGDVVFKHCRAPRFYVASGGSLSMDHCVATSDPIYKRKTAVKVSPRAKSVSLIGNIFENYGRCLSINTGERLGADQSAVRIVIKENSLAGSSSDHPFTVVAPLTDPEVVGALWDENNCSIQGNILGRTMDFDSNLLCLVSNDADPRYSSDASSLSGSD